MADTQFRNTSNGNTPSRNTPSGYTSNQIMTMQQDAIRRVNEMQRIARARVANAENSPENSQMQIEHHQPQSNPIKDEHIKPHHENHEHHEEKKEEIVMVEPCQTSGLPNVLVGFLDRMNLDTETLLLMGLIFLLVNEGADVMLLLALGYILL